MELLGKWYASGEPVRIEILGTQVANAEHLETTPEAAGLLPWIAPGLVDLQLNGYGGQEFSSDDLTVERVGEIVDAVPAFGVTQFLPTLTTNSLETLTSSLQTIDRACREPQIAARVPGLHLEGPYVSPEDGARGAHPLSCCRRPDWDEFCRLQEASGNRIRILTLSAEYEETPGFIARAVETGLIVSIGHTAATPDQIREAADAGATMSTHLGNGSHPTLPRHHNYVWAQLADDRFTAGIIADGHHLPPEVVKTFVRAKEAERCVLVSDMSGYAGLAPGTYQTELCDLEILPSGKLVVAGQRELLAGASAPLLDGVANVMRFAGIELAAAVDMASRRPAGLLKAATGDLVPGARADFVLFHLHREEGGLPERIELERTICCGETCWDVRVADVASDSA